MILFDRRHLPRLAIATTLFVSAWINPWFSPAVVAVLALWLLRTCARHTNGGDRALVAAITCVFILHVTIATALFLISYLHLPVLTTLQQGEGFWAFAADSDGYHVRSLAMADAIRRGRPLPALSSTVTYEFFIAATYLVFGSLPLTAIIFNCGVVAAAGLIAYWLGRHFGGTARSCLVVVVIVTCWPSGFIWSSQLLRDSFAFFLTLASLAAIAASLDARRERGLSNLRLFAALAATVIAVTSIRVYVGWLFFAAVAIVVLMIAAGIVRHATRFADAVAVLLLIGVATVVGSGYTFVSTFNRNVEQARALTPNDGAPSGASGRFNADANGAAPGKQGSMRALDVVPRLLEQKRRELAVGSHASIGTSADLTSWRGLFAFLPEAVVTALVAPFPSDWKQGKTTGVFKSLAVVEGFAMAILLPVLVLGLFRAARGRQSGTTFALLYGLIALLFLSLIIPNLGGLVRLRPPAILPLVIIAISHGGLEIYPKLFNVLHKSQR